MEAYEMPKHVMFKAIDGRPCTAWPMLSEKAAPMPTGEDRESAFADFPNISTPIDLISVYGRLAYSPIYPLFKQGEIANIKKPEILLDAFGLAPTRTNLNGAKDILASSNVPRYESFAHSPCVLIRTVWRTRSVAEYTTRLCIYL